MHSAPSVSYPVGRSRLVRSGVLVVWLLGVLAACGWWLQTDGAAWQRAVLALALLAAAVGAGRACRLGEGLRLRWDGRQWCAEDARRCLQRASVTVHLDFQSLMLVRLRAPGERAAWLWLQREADPAQWRALRRAVHAPVAADLPGRP